MQTEHKFIFLCGLHRSGTSPLFRILREHSEISGFRDTGVPEDEGQHLQTVFPAAKEFGGAGRFGFAPQAHLTESSTLINEVNRKKLFDNWSQHWDLSKPYLLEKSPPNLIRTRFFQEMFRDSSFIVLLRHPVATCLATRKWSDSTLESLFQHWLHCHCLFDLDRQFLNRVHVLKYEELISDTEAALARIYEFLGLKPQTFIPLDPTGNDRYFRLWHESLNDRSYGRAVNAIVRKHEAEVRRFGYSLTRLYDQKTEIDHSGPVNLY